MNNSDPPRSAQTKRSAKKKAKIMKPGNASTESDASASSLAVPPLRKQVSKSKAKGKARKLEGIVIMPLDVLFEILSYLHPLDILHLSRTTKAFRRVLMNKTHASVWKAARENVRNYPECFPDMNEVQMARLAFDTHCYTILTVESGSLVEIGPLIRMIKIGVTTINWEDGLPALACTKDGSRTGSVLAFSQEIDSIKAHLATLEPDEVTAYVEKRLNFKRKVNKRIERSQELQKARDSRRAAITKKLVELGWGSELENIPEQPLKDTLIHHRLVKQPTRLTARIWTNIKPEMINYMERMKRNRMERERQAIIISRKSYAIEAVKPYKISQLPWTEVMPEPPDYCRMKPIKAILELPIDTDVDASSFAAAVLELPSLFAEWQQDLKTQTLLQLQQHCSPNPFTGPFIGPPSLDTVQKLQLAATAFRCLRCNAGHAHNIYGDWDKAEPLLYPKLLNHTCFTRQLYPSNNSDDSVRLKNSYFRSREGWNNGLLRVDTDGVDMMEAIIKFCNLDPASATLNDLDDLDVWLGCRDCADWYEGPDVAEVSVFGWRNALKHQVERHSSKPVGWLELSGDQKTQANKNAPLGTIKGNCRKLITTTTERWSCVHCMDSICESEPQILDDLMEHLLDMHEITTPSINIDYYTLNPRKIYAHRASWANFNIKGDPQHRQIIKDVFAAVYRSVVNADATDSELEDGLADCAMFARAEHSDEEGYYSDSWTSALSLLS
ncbi:hypothetical protein HWV62_5826 [Athelia sp. TMB]|nr:hypothetical protein HWV62_5826 [Athelia sp. TMB]